MLACSRLKGPDLTLMPFCRSAEADATTGEKSCNKTPRVLGKGGNDTPTRGEKRGGHSPLIFSKGGNASPVRGKGGNLSPLQAGRGRDEDEEAPLKSARPLKLLGDSFSHHIPTASLQDKMLRYASGAPSAAHGPNWISSGRAALVRRYLESDATRCKIGAKFLVSPPAALSHLYKAVVLTQSGAAVPGPAATGWCVHVSVRVRLTVCLRGYVCAKPACACMCLVFVRTTVFRLGWVKFCITACGVARMYVVSGSGAMRKHARTRIRLP